MANPHSIDMTNNKGVSYDALKRYHHSLLKALGLTQDTGVYKYAGERTDFPEGIESVSAALDALYDLAKDGAVTFSEGKHVKEEGESDPETVKFSTDDGEDTNLYWINAKVGDKYVNIEIDANNFVKDSVLKSVMLLNISGSTEETTDRTYKVNGKDATYYPANSTSVSETEETEETAETSKSGKLVVTETGDIYYVGSDVETLADGTYFYYTWITSDGEKGDSYSYTSVSLKDVYGDIKGDDYIKFDSATAQIQAQVADVVDVKDDDTGKKIWTVNSEEGDDTNLATAENVAAVATDLQDQIDNNKLVDGTVTFSSSDDNSLTVTADGNAYTLNLKMASDDDIDNLFVACAVETIDAEKKTDVENVADPANTKLNVYTEDAETGLTDNTNTFNSIYINEGE